ncbi:MAG: cobalamin-dependent protein, partial [Elusimicrobiota bacterium]
MNITLINPRIHDTPNRPLGLLYVAASLEIKGYNVFVLDPHPEESMENICNYVLKHQPEIIGLTATTPQITKALAISKELKKLSNAPIVLGGVHPTVMYEKILTEDYNIDYVVIGEGEVTIIELCKKIKDWASLSTVKGIAFRQGNSVRITESRGLIADLDSISFPARHLLSSKWHTAPPRIRGVWKKATEIV